MDTSSATDLETIANQIAAELRSGDFAGATPVLPKVEDQIAQKKFAMLGTVEKSNDRKTRIDKLAALISEHVNVNQPVADVAAATMKQLDRIKHDLGMNAPKRTKGVYAKTPKKLADGTGNSPQKCKDICARLNKLSDDAHKMANFINNMKTPSSKLVDQANRHRSDFVDDVTILNCEMINFLNPRNEK